MFMAVDSNSRAEKDRGAGFLTEPEEAFFGG